MLLPLLGSESCERVLVFIYGRGEGYATQIAHFFNTNLFSIQNQLDKLEQGSVLVSQKKGRTRLYTLNPRYPFLKELVSLLTKALTYYPMEIQEGLLMNRRRPRRRQKTL